MRRPVDEVLLAALRKARRQRTEVNAENADLRCQRNLAVERAERAERALRDTLPGCRCGLYVGACPLHEDRYRADAMAAIEADRAARRKP